MFIMIKEVIFLRKIFVLTFIVAAIFSSDIVYGAESINDYIMEEITDNTSDPFYTIPIRLGHYINFDFKITKHIILITLAGILSVLCTRKPSRPPNPRTKIRLCCTKKKAECFAACYSA